MVILIPQNFSDTFVNWLRKIWNSGVEAAIDDYLQYLIEEYFTIFQIKVLIMPRLII